jgi:hypothetical protein
MELNDTAVPVFFMLCGVILIPTLAVMSGLIFSLAAGVERGMTHSAVRVRGSKRWRRYEHRKNTGQ